MIQAIDKNEGPPKSMDVKFTADPKLVLRFIGVFSRLEYCLKVTRFRQQGDGEAKADWKAFIGAAEAGFDPAESPELAEAYGYARRASGVSDQIEILSII